MKIVNIIGGLGNQLFQYAFAIALKAEFPEEEVKINTSCFKYYPLHNGFELVRIFNINTPRATLSDLFKYAYPWANYKLWQIGHNLLPNRKSMVWDVDFKNKFDFNLIEDKSYFDGYWQAPKFFEKHRDSVINAYNFPAIKDDKNIKILQFIGKRSTAFIHVRRGDYINHPLFGGICSLVYYKNAINLLRNKYKISQFLIFSNDIDWCKNNIKDLLNGTETRYVDWNKGENSHYDIQLMSKCKAGIVANSSFSWWGAWLSDSNIIIAPNRWTNNPQINQDIIPDSWIRCDTL